MQPCIVSMHTGGKRLGRRAVSLVLMLHEGRVRSTVSRSRAHHWEELYLVVQRPFLPIPDTAYMIEPCHTAGMGSERQYFW